MRHEELNALRIGNVMRSIRMEKDVPIKSIASTLHVSESTISQLETGKNLASMERCKDVFLAYDCQFDYDADFNVVRNDLFEFYKSYCQVNEESLVEQMKSYFNTRKYFYSFGRFEFVLILYLYSIVSEKLYIVEKYRLDEIIEFGLSSLNVKEKSIYYDLKSTYYFWQHQINEARTYIVKSLELDSYNFMTNYHYGLINLRMGYFMVASKYFDLVTKEACNLVIFERLLYITLCKSIILLYTYQFDDAMHMSLNLLKECKKRENSLRLQKSIISNIALNYLLQKKYVEALNWINKVDEKNMDEREMMYKIYSLYRLKQYDQCRFFIKIYSDILNHSRYSKEFIKGIKYSMSGKSDKCIYCLEICYKIAKINGEIDKAILILRVLENLYFEFNYSDKLQRVYEIFNEFYKMSYSNNVIEYVDIELID